MNIYQAKCAEALAGRLASMPTNGWEYSSFVGDQGGWRRAGQRSDLLVFAFKERWARVMVRHSDGRTLREAFYATRDEALTA